MNQQSASANSQQSSATGHNVGKDGTVQFKAQPPVGKQANDTGLPLQLKSGIEQLSGYSLDDVKVHYNSAEPAQLQAHAFARGTDIHVASGQEKHLAHEAWHVVQQKQGRVKPTTQLKGNAINDDVSLETEADVMGSKAAAQPFTTQLRHVQAANAQAVIQGKWSYLTSIDLESDSNYINGAKAFVSQNKLIAAIGTILVNPAFKGMNDELRPILDACHRERKLAEVVHQTLYNTLHDKTIFSIAEIIDLILDHPVVIEYSALFLEAAPERFGYEDAVDEELVDEGESVDSLTTGDSDHPEGSDAVPEPVYPNELETGEFEEIPDSDEILRGVFNSLLQYHGINIEIPGLADHFFLRWKTGVHTRSFWQRVKSEVQSGKSVDQVAQMARTGNTESYQDSYKTKNFGVFKKVSYMRDAKGNINFSKPKKYTTWKNPVKSSTEVALNQGMKNKKYGLTPGGQKIPIATASRPQHFAIGDRLSPWAKANRKGAWTWHHLSKEYNMVLVDMTVHAKHGHNGGFLLWK